jgi:hypothetical protein
VRAFIHSGRSTRSTSLCTASRPHRIRSEDWGRGGGLGVVVVDELGQQAQLAQVCVERRRLLFPVNEHASSLQDLHVASHIHHGGLEGAMGRSEGERVRSASEANPRASGRAERGMQIGRHRHVGWTGAGARGRAGARAPSMEGGAKVGR